MARSMGGLDDVRAYGHKAERVAALIYAHFKKEFGSSGNPADIVHKL